MGGAGSDVMDAQQPSGTRVQAAVTAVELLRPPPSSTLDDVLRCVDLLKDGDAEGGRLAGAVLGARQDVRDLSG